MSMVLPTQNFKRFLDGRAPAVARRLRRLRDNLHWRSPTATMTNYGFTLIGDEGIAQSRTDSHEVAALTREFHPTSVFVDVGANVGFFSCLAAKSLDTVIAIEPHPLNLGCLYENIRSNDLKIEVFPMALHSRPGVADLFGGGQGASLVKGWGGIRSTYATPVPINTLDNLLAGRFADRHLIIKIDTEGNELAVLQGAHETLRRSARPTWLVEIGLTENFDGRINPNFAQTFEIFWAHGYEARSVQAERPVHADDVSRWVAHGRRDFGGVDFMFS